MQVDRSVNNCYSAHSTFYLSEEINPKLLKVAGGGGYIKLRNLLLVVVVVGHGGGGGR